MFERGILHVDTFTVLNKSNRTGLAETSYLFCPCCICHALQGYSVYVQGLYVICCMVLVLAAATVGLMIILRNDSTRNRWLQRYLQCTSELLAMTSPWRQQQLRAFTSSQLTEECCRTAVEECCRTAMSDHTGTSLCSSSPRLSTAHAHRSQTCTAPPTCSLVEFAGYHWNRHRLSSSSAVLSELFRSCRSSGHL